jgi:hypothetical protein
MSVRTMLIDRQAAATWLKRWDAHTRDRTSPIGAATQWEPTCRILPAGFDGTEPVVD